MGNRTRYGNLAFTKENWLVFKDFWPNHMGTALITFSPHVTYQIEFASFHNISTDRLVYSVRVDDVEIINIETDDQIFGNNAWLIFGKCWNCTITDVQYDFDRNASGKSTHRDLK